MQRSPPILAIVAICLAVPPPKLNAVNPGDNRSTRQSSQWVRDHFSAEDSAVPFSFVYNGQPSAQSLPAWHRRIASARLDSNREQRTMVWNDEKTGLEVKCVAVEFADFPAVEWTVFFKNVKTANTPILERIKAIDVAFPAESHQPARLHYINGDGETWGKLQFAPQEKLLDPFAEIRFGSRRGRPTDPCFPYYNLQWNGRGVLLALGWPGQWSSSFHADARCDLRVEGGQAETHLTLRPAL